MTWIDVVQAFLERMDDATYLEAMHTEAVLQWTTEKLVLIGVVKSDIQAEATELMASVGEGVFGKIQRQKVLEQNFSECVGMPKRKTSEAMKRSIRQLCQNLRDNPNIAENMAKVGTVRHSILVLFNNALNDLRSGQNVQSMIDALKEHQKTEMQIKETMAREKQISEAVRRLRMEHSQEALQHETDIERQNCEMKALKMTLRTKKVEKAFEIELYEKECQAVNENAKFRENEHLCQLRDELQNAQATIEIERDRHEGWKGYFERIKKSMEMEFLDWKAETNKTMESKRCYIEASLDTFSVENSWIQYLTNAKEEKEKQLKEIQIALRKEIENKHERDMKRKIEEESGENSSVMNERAQRAAIRIQALWRGWKTRKRLCRAKSASSKGKKKK